MLRDGTPVAFYSVKPMPGLGRANCVQESRVVVLPEFQGLGIGPALSSNMGQVLLRSEVRLFARTSHPRLGQVRDKPGSGWKKQVSSGQMVSENFTGSQTEERRVFSHEFKGKSDPPSSPGLHVLDAMLAERAAALRSLRSQARKKGFLRA